MDETTWNGEMLLTPDQAAEWLALERKTLDGWRYDGGGPKFVRISQRCIRYRRKDLVAWVEARVRLSTSDPDPEDLVEGVGRGWA